MIQINLREESECNAYRHTVGICVAFVEIECDAYLALILHSG